MSTSFDTALSALNAISTAINVVGNNLANLNTTGYKTDDVSFYDMVTDSQGAGSGQTQVGLGVGQPLTSADFSQGTLESSAGPMDAAIQGNGFFIVNNGSDGTGGQLYTRAGNFQLDAQGDLLTSTGQYVQGWNASATGVVDTNAAISNIQVPVGQLSTPVTTTEMSLGLNLDAASTPGSADATFSTPIQVVDSLGNPQTLTVTFTQDPTTPLTWDYQVTVPGNATTAGTAGTPTNLLGTPGTLTFNSSGQLVSPAATDGGIALNITGLSDNAADMNITWNLYDSAGAPTMTQLAQASAVSSVQQNGEAPSELTGVSMGDNGQVMAAYSNGNQMVVAQLALASIPNPESLISVGSNNYQASAQTALPAVGVADTGGRGEVVGQSLESSNADIADQFTQLIVLQRAYEANSRVVTTADQLSQDTIGLIHS